MFLFKTRLITFIYGVPHNEYVSSESLNARLLIFTIVLQYQTLNQSALALKAAKIYWTSNVYIINISFVTDCSKEVSLTQLI